MKKNETKGKVQEMRSEYDFSGGVRGKYAKRFAQGTNLVALDSELTKIYKDSDSVNRALLDSIPEEVEA